MITIKLPAYVLLFVLAATGWAETETGTATILANAVAFSTRLHLSGRNVKAVCTSPSPDCLLRHDRYTTMKLAIDNLVECLTSSQVTGCSANATVATIETSRYVDLMEATHITSDKALVAFIPPFAELLLLIARHHATTSHRRVRVPTQVRALTSRGATGAPDLQEPDDSVLLYLNTVRLPAWSEL